MSLANSFHSASAALCASLIMAVHAEAQRVPTRAPRPGPVWVDSSAASIMRVGGPNRLAVDVIIDVLRQQSKPLPLSKRREVAESLVARAVLPPADRDRPLIPLNAVEAIALSGMAESARGGTPDPAALDRLIRIHRDARLSVVAIAAIGQFAYQVDPARALPYLQSLAESSTGGTSRLALEEIIGLAQNVNTREPATAALRELWGRERTAPSVLCRFAADHNWVRPPEKKCSID